jgi:hypothetical protein
MYEIETVSRSVEAPNVLLKGAAYPLADLPPAHGRFFSNVDTLVPQHAWPSVESALMLGGVATTRLHPYDQRQYRLDALGTPRPLCARPLAEDAAATPRVALEPQEPARRGKHRVNRSPPDT